MNKKIKQIKNENAAVERVRVVCYGFKEASKKINFGSHITMRHGPNYKNDHNVIQVLADGIVIGNVIHKKLIGDKICNIKNNDEVINLIEDNMTVNLVLKRGYELIIDIPLKRFNGLL